MSDDLLRRLDEWGAAKRLEYLPSLGRQAAARIRELDAERDAVQHLFAQQELFRDELLAENERLRGLLREARDEIDAWWQKYNEIGGEHYLVAVIDAALARGEKP